METKANFVLIGAFTLAGLLGILGFFLWFAQVELDRQFDYYDIRFSSVSGLSNASDVRFSGLPVGQVVDVRLSPNQDGTILVRVEVDAATPVRTDSIATIEAQGVTGVSFVGIGPGSPNAALLEPTDDKPVPEITAGRSTLQSLSEDAPRLLEETLQLVTDVGDLLGAENRARINSIIANVETASAEFAETLDGFSSISTTVSDFAEQINRFNETLNTLTGDLTEVLQTADATLTSIGELSEQGKGVLTTGADTLTSARSAIDRTETYIATDLTQATADLRATAAALQTELTALSADARALLATLNTTGATATARLQEAQATLQATDALIARLDGTAEAVTETAGSIDTLIRDEGAPLLSETRAMVAEADRAIASVATVANEDLPVIIADIRQTAETFRTVATEVGGNLTASSQSAEAVLDTARVTLEDARVSFANANTTLAAINDALVTGDRALGAAERAFAGADRVINEDLDGIITGLETSLGSLDAAIAQVSADIPGMSADLRAASQAASDTFAELRNLTSAASPSIREFTTTALPLYSRLAQESRALIANLDRLTEQIQRDPTRFFLDSETPEFRR
ncbi:MAG: MCE family protein [Marivita sp.]|uniref:MlaD family protein n=1 Tax=Marivita sp. TaxID=2003365 RepID=UPI001AFCE6A6|nr:MlaD family protein [Marivita sp.]MBO6885586.1 MCE family protein [Marivita sp.]